MKKDIIIAVLVIIGTLVLASFGPKLRGTSQRVASGNRIEVEEVKIDTCVYHAFYNCYNGTGGIFVIRVKWEYLLV